MTDIIEVHDYITSEDFAVDPHAMREFLENYFHLDLMAGVKLLAQSLQESTEEIERICQDMNKGGHSSSLHIDYAPGIYRDELPACGWIKEED